MRDMFERYNYYMCLNDKNYNVSWKIAYDREVVETLETMLDNMINLLKSYGVSDEEIIEEIKDNLDLDIEEE